MQEVWGSNPNRVTDLELRKNELEKLELNNLSSMRVSICIIPLPVTDLPNTV